jgi:GNAT superfamily N-acetyltransferase
MQTKGSSGGGPERSKCVGARAMTRIVRLAEMRGGSAQAVSEAEAIFWESAGTRQFTGEAERVAYRSLWFGRYLEHAPGEFLLALDEAGEVAGYLAGAAVSNASPVPGPDYYPLFPDALIAAYPAHLHANVRAGSRGAGIGAALVRTFAAHCRAQGLPGVHAVTARGSRAAAFFGKCGLAECAAVEWRGRPLVFLARHLAD